MKRSLLTLVAFALCGCGIRMAPISSDASVPPTSGDASVPPTSDDASTPSDLAPPTSSCTVRTECRLYPSYCVTAPCHCIALGRQDVNPPCVGGQMICLVDPCQGKAADCVGGACVVTP